MLSYIEYDLAVIHSHRVPPSLFEVRSILEGA